MRRRRRRRADDIAVDNGVRSRQERSLAVAAAPGVAGGRFPADCVLERWRRRYDRRDRRRREGLRDVVRRRAGAGGYRVVVLAVQGEVVRSLGLQSGVLQRTLARLAVAVVVGQLHRRSSWQRQGAGRRAHQVIVVRPTILVQRPLLHLHPAGAAEVDAVDFLVAPSHRRQFAAAVAANEELAGRAAVARQEGVRGLAPSGAGDLRGRVSRC